MEWNENTECFPYLDLPPGEDLEPALAEWWRRLMAHGEEASDWNVVVADAWAETGRIIGHVQHVDQAVGMDRGYRVTLTQLEVSEPLNKAMTKRGYPPGVYEKCAKKLLDDICRSAKSDAVKSWFETKKVTLWVCENGERRRVRYRL